MNNSLASLSLVTLFRETYTARTHARTPVDGSPLSLPQTVAHQYIAGDPISTIYINMVSSALLAAACEGAAGCRASIAAPVLTPNLLVANRERLGGGVREREAGAAAVDVVSFSPSFSSLVTRRPPRVDQPLCVTDAGLSSRLPNDL